MKALIRVCLWAWPLIFLVPLTWVAGRECEYIGVDPAYHTVMWLHENLPVLYAALGLIAAITVAIRVGRVRARASTLFALAVEPPECLTLALRDESARLRMPIPPLAYLDVATPMCFALVGRRESIVISRGFLDGLDARQTRLIARHELLHIRYRDPVRGFLWHIAFAVFLLPAFERLEAWFASRRELRTNLEAAVGDAEVYANLLRLKAISQRGMCIDVVRGTPRAGSLSIALIAPAIVFAVLVGLATSHAWFIEHLAYLTVHHC